MASVQDNGADQPNNIMAIFIDLKREFSSFRIDINTKIDHFSKQIALEGTEEEICPQFAQAIGNISQAVGREARLECVVDNLGRFRLEPESVVEFDIEGSETVPVKPVVNDIVSLTKNIRLEVNKTEIDYLVKESSLELPNEVLKEFHCVSQQKVMEKSFSEKEEVAANQQSSGTIREMLKVRETVASYIEKHHPNQAVVMRATNLFNDDSVQHFRHIFKSRQKQMFLDDFLVIKK
ncbi:hypothetical protein AVEN_209332-1 [Araneus ventricosus]|uniref:Uncharacterized protein n=1 Tax=Araneus ventricosus TaxID=182803 RepID=A0A4Y2CBD1_ARAVE|nr:hypothetical protein AVEN_209332-1 [Araneus ventricosus]